MNFVTTTTIKNITKTTTDLTHFARLNLIKTKSFVSTVSDATASASSTSIFNSSYPSSVFSNSQHPDFVSSSNINTSHSPVTLSYSPISPSYSPITPSYSPEPSKPNPPTPTISSPSPTLSQKITCLPLTLINNNNRITTNDPNFKTKDDERLTLKINLKNLVFNPNRSSTKSKKSQKIPKIPKTPKKQIAKDIEILQPPIQSSTPITETTTVTIIATTTSAPIHQIPLTPPIEIENKLEDLTFDYENSIDTWNYLKTVESRYYPMISYFEKQFEIKTPKHRKILVEWLMEVSFSQKYKIESLYLAIHILDRFLSKNSSMINERFQTFGTLCLFIACQYTNGISYSSIEDFLCLSPLGIWIYSNTEAKTMQRFILETLNFDLGCPDPIYFFKRLQNVSRIMK